MNDLHASDLAHLWHPYTQINAFEKSTFPIIERAEGVYLYDTEGRAILDGISSWWACNLGHSHPKLVEAIRNQAEVLQHSILGGMTHPSAIRLSEKLAEMTPGNLSRCFFASDGASAVEAALKISLQYWHNLGKPERNEFATLADAYHGDTLGAMNVGYLPGFHAPYEAVLRKSYQAAFPSPDGHADEDLPSMETIIREHHNTLAAVILEPLCQGAAGMRIYSPEFLRQTRDLCNEHNILLIADEIAMGFGRTGEMFACNHADVVPNILCLGKGLTGGTLPMSATVLTKEIYNTFRNEGGQDRTFYHGHTFCGNPIASAVALAALEIYQQPDFLPEVHARGETLRKGIEALSSYECVESTDHLGMIGVFNLRDSNKDGTEVATSFAKQVAAKAFDLGLLIRPLGNVIYLLPPLVTTEDELKKMSEILERALSI